jgi:hypothetical protein
VDSITSDTSGIELRFRAVAGKTYTVQYRNPADTNPWQRLVDVPAQSATGELLIIDERPEANASRLYRLVTPETP